jgi:hypothetical protein
LDRSGTVPREPAAKTATVARIQFTNTKEVTSCKQILTSTGAVPRQVRKLHSWDAYRSTIHSGNSEDSQTKKDACRRGLDWVGIEWKPGMLIPPPL